MQRLDRGGPRSAAFSLSSAGHCRPGAPAAADEEWQVAVRIYEAKNNAIERAAKRKKDALAPQKVLNKLWDNDSFIKEAEIEHLCLALAASRASVAARDAEIELLKLQMRRMSRRCARIGRAKMFGCVPRRVSFKI